MFDSLDHRIAPSSFVAGGGGDTTSYIKVVPPTGPGGSPTDPGQPTTPPTTPPTSPPTTTP